MNYLFCEGWDYNFIANICGSYVLQWKLEEKIT